MLWGASGAAAVGVVALAGSLLFRGQDTTDRAPATATARAPVVVATAALAPLEPAEPAMTASAALTIEPRTVSVMDLPTVSPPAPVVPVAVPVAVAPATTALVAVATEGAPAPALAASASARLGIPRAIAAFASASAAPRAPASCSPPYFYDELGLKVFKPECVN
jgi:hypothetical protein